MMQGRETGLFGKHLATRLRASQAHSGWSVYYDHGDAAADSNVAVTKGFIGRSVTNLNRLADIDILVASSDNVAHMLIEIEERACSPKKILGNVL